MEAPSPMPEEPDASRATPRRKTSAARSRSTPDSIVEEMVEAEATPDLAQQIAALFAEHVNPRAPAMMQVIDQLPRFVRTYPDGRLAIDPLMFLFAILDVGQSMSARSDFGNSAVWLYRWICGILGQEEVDALIRSSESDIGDVSVQEVTLSRPMAEFTLPRAHELAEKSVRRPVIDLHHILFALVELPAGDWPGPLTAVLGPEKLLQLRYLLVEQITASPEPDEDVSFWRELVANPEALRAPSPPTPTEHLRTLGDQPAMIDSLGRQKFAEVLAMRLRDAQAEMEEARQKAIAAGQEPTEAGAFMAHIHGPWGFGKTSTLNFLRKELEDPGKNEATWLVVDFNAWKHHRLRPPWWSLISAVYNAAIIAPKVRQNWRLRTLWWGWRLRADWLPILLVAAILGLIGFGVATVLNSAATPNPNVLSSGETALKVLTAILTASAGVYAYIRFLLFGSAKAADAYAELKTDPYRPVMRLFGKLVGAIDRPVAIFIDDLDRCESDYVAELIEGIQTLLRGQPVVYVIAADRKWICAAFEKKYKDFAANIGDPGRPLGYLFLDKLFQISAPLPAITASSRHRYWQQLLNRTPAGENAGTITAEDAARQVQDKVSAEELTAVIAEAPEGDKPALRAAAAVQITRAEAATLIEHRLAPLASLLEPNPRAMKRLVNAVGMAQSRLFLEGREEDAVSLPALARWTLIELRWPVLADYLADNIDAVALAVDASDRSGLPLTIGVLLIDRHVRATLSLDDIDHGLSVDRLRAILA